MNLLIKLNSRRQEGKTDGVRVRFVVEGLTRTCDLGFQLQQRRRRRKKVGKRTRDSLLLKKLNS